MSDTATNASETIQEVGSSKQELRFAKIVSTPTDTTWSQAYNAGTLFVVLAISQKEDQEEKLSSIGKNILNTLEEEFFTLEIKDFPSIQKAVEITLDKTSSITVLDLALGFIKEDIFYAFLKGDGAILLKRDDSFGILLEKETTLEGASGNLQKGDVIILATKQFLETFPQEELEHVIDHNQPSEIAETLSPKIHEKEIGGASSIIISFEKENPKTHSIEPLPDHSVLPHVPKETPPPPKPLSFSFSSFRLPTISIPASPLLFFKELTHSKKMFLSVSILLISLLVVSIFFSIKTRSDAQTKEKFDKIYKAAQKEYDEGTALASLNKNLAREDFQNALSITEKGLLEFKKGSTEYEKLSDLQNSIKENLGTISGSQTIKTREVDSKVSPYLTAVLKNIKSSYFAKNDTTIFYIDGNGIQSIDIKSDQTKQVIKNDDLWKKPGGLSSFGNNLYLLDTETSQILKFSGITTPPSNYFSEEPDLSNAVNMTIDSSVYILLSDGTVTKFLRGKQESFTTTGLDGKLSHPTRIFTDTDTDNVYILDDGNERIVVLGKSGAYITQYKADILKDAKDFDVREKDKKIYVLSGGKIWQIDI